MCITVYDLQHITFRGLKNMAQQMQTLSHFFLLPQSSSSTQMRLAKKNPIHMN